MARIKLTLERSDIPPLLATGFTGAAAGGCLVRWPIVKIGPHRTYPFLVAFYGPDGSNDEVWVHQDRIAWIDTTDEED